MIFSSITSVEKQGKKEQNLTPSAARSAHLPLKVFKQGRTSQCVPASSKTSCFFFFPRQHPEKSSFFIKASYQACHSESKVE